MYDSHGATEGDRNDQAKAEFNAGVSLYLDSGHGVVRGQVKLLRDAPEQFVATYRGNDAGLLSGLAEAVVEMADNEGWQIRRDAGGNQALFDALASGAAFDQEALDQIQRALERRDLPLSRLRKLLGKDEPVDVSVPDYITAAQTVALVERRIEGSHTLAVSESTSASTVQDADLFVIPTGRVEEAGPGPNLQERFRRRRAKEATAEFERAVENLASAAGEDDTSRSLVAALHKADTERRVHFRATDGGPVWIEGIIPRLIVSSSVTTVIALLLAILMSPTELVSLLAASPTYPIVGTVDAPAWQIVSPAVGLGVIGLFLVISPAFQQTAKRGPGTDKTVPTAADREGRAVTSTLHELAETVDKDSFQTLTAEILAPYEVSVLDEEEVRRDHRVRAILGVGGGLLVGVALFFLFSIALPILGDALQNRLSTVTLVFVAGSVAVFGLGLAVKLSAAQEMPPE